MNVTHQLPLSFEPARIMRDAAIALVAVNAGDEFAEAAYKNLLTYAKYHTNFLTEDVRVFAEGNGMNTPHDNRAWGAIIVRAVKENVIKRIGYAPSKTGHMRPMPVWESLVLLVQP